MVKRERHNQDFLQCRGKTFVGTMPVSPERTHNIYDESTTRQVVFSVNVPMAKKYYGVNNHFAHTQTITTTPLNQ